MVHLIYSLTSNDKVEMIQNRPYKIAEFRFKILKIHYFGVNLDKKKLSLIVFLGHYQQNAT